MTATVTTKQIKDAAGNVFLQRVLDESGTGAGPFLPLNGLVDPDGSGPVDIAALADAIIAAIGGASAAAAGDTGASSTNGFLRYLRDKLAAGIALGAGAATIGRVGLQAGGSDLSASNPLPVGAAQVATATATIASGQSLSGTADLGTGRLVGLILPSAWTTASITFRGSADGTTFFDLYDDGIERAVASGSAVAGRFLALPITDWLGIRALQVRSGGAAAAVSQSADRIITLVTAR